MVDLEIAETEAWRRARAQLDNRPEDVAAKETAAIARIQRGIGNTTFIGAVVDCNFFNTKLPEGRDPDTPRVYRAANLDVSLYIEPDNPDRLITAFFTYPKGRNTIAALSKDGIYKFGPVNETYPREATRPIYAVSELKGTPGARPFLDVLTRVIWVSQQPDFIDK